MSGAISVFEANELADILDMPIIETLSGKKKKRRISPEILVAELEKHASSVTKAYIENVHAMPGQGVSSMFAFGEALGLVRGIMAGFKISTELVSPVSWKRGLRLGQGKDASRAMAASMWPYAAHFFKRQRDDGRAEAALIAHWAMTQAR